MSSRKPSLQEQRLAQVEGAITTLNSEMGIVQETLAGIKVEITWVKRFAGIALLYGFADGLGLIELLKSAILGS